MDVPAKSTAVRERIGSNSLTTRQLSSSNPMSGGQRGTRGPTTSRSSQSRAITEWPADLDQERNALGAALCGQAADAAQLLQPDDFSLSAHREIFCAITAVIEQEESALEEVLLVGELRRRGTLDAVGGLSYLSVLADGVVLARPMESRAKRLREFAERRKLLTASAELSRRARDLAVPIGETQAWLREVAQ